MALGPSLLVERTGPAVRAAFIAYSSAEECVQFEAELRSALARAAEDLDLAGPQEVLAHWHALATADANPFTDEEREQIERMSAGDYTGLRTRDEHGNWVEYSVREEPIPTVGIRRLSSLGDL
ncbi:MAG: DUF6247 family protein [Pseudonocardiaceae bacterium]